MKRKRGGNAPKYSNLFLSLGDSHMPMASSDIVSRKEQYSDSSKSHERVAL